MTDGPRIMPHPDDPPPGTMPPRTPPTTPSEPEIDVASVLAAMPDRIESTTEQEPFGQWAMGAGGLAALLMLFEYTVGGIPLLIPVLVTMVAIYCGVRGVLAARSGRASNRLMSLLGLAAAGVALVSILVHYLVITPAVKSVLDGATSGA